MILSLAIGPSPANPPVDSVAPSVKLELGLARTRARLNSLVVGENDQPRCKVTSEWSDHMAKYVAAVTTTTHTLTELNRLGLVLEEQQPRRICQRQSSVGLFMTRSNFAPTHISDMMPFSHTDQKES